MALPQRFIEKDRYTEEDYFAFEETSFGRWEYVKGEIRAMSGGTPDHSAIAINLATALAGALRGAGNRTCRVFGSDLKIHTADGLNTYPDVSVVCGHLSFHGKRRDVVTNPLLIAEVLSPSTEAYDRSDKWESYQTILSLQSYLLVATDRERAEVYTRQESGWHFQTYEGLEASLPLPALGMTLPLADLYALVEFTEEDTSI